MLALPVLTAEQYYWRELIATFPYSILLFSNPFWLKGWCLCIHILHRVFFWEYVQYVFDSTSIFSIQNVMWQRVSMKNYLTCEASKSPCHRCQRLIKASLFLTWFVKFFHQWKLPSNYFHPTSTLSYSEFFPVLSYLFWDRKQNYKQDRDEQWVHAVNNWTICLSRHYPGYCVSKAYDTIRLWLYSTWFWAQC